MTREEIESMLASIGVTRFAERPLNWKHAIVMFTKFADLVAAKEREACELAVKSESLEDCDDQNESDESYNLAIHHAACAILARNAS